MRFSSAQLPRWLAVIFLTAAVSMLIYGLTALEGKLSNHDFVSYWMVCLVFTVLAAWMALLDLRTIRYQSREAQRELIEQTLEEVERERRQKFEN